jgi:hypothetical protein
MRPKGVVAVALVASFLTLAGCSVSPVRQEITTRNSQLQLAKQAWQATRIRLHSMCPHVPKAVEELAAALKYDHANGCYARLAKDTYAPTLDDWHWHWFPPYQVVIAVHDEELRKRRIPKLHEEYMLGLTRYLGEKADNDEITSEQLRHAFNAGWNWLRGKMQEEPLLLQENVSGLESANGALRETMASVAGGLATVATLALAVSADDKTYRPAPANCYVYPVGQRNYTVQCY